MLLAGSSKGLYIGCPRLTGCLSRRYYFQGVYDFPSVVVYDFQGSDKGFPRHLFGLVGHFKDWKG